MKQYTYKEFIKIVQYNGFIYNRTKGDHNVFVNASGRHISAPLGIKACIARRLIKENNLDLNIKNKKNGRKN